MSFFEPKEPRPRTPGMGRRHRAQPPWIERPRGVLLGGVAEEILLVRTASVGIALTHIGASADGFGATLVVMTTGGDEDEFDDTPFGWGPWARRMDPEQLLRFGVRYSDGTQAELDGGPPRRRERPDGPVISTGGGGGGGGEWRQNLWLWPLPPPGQLTFAVEWRARDVELKLHELDAAPIREAALRAQTLFTAEELSDTPEFSGGAMHFFEDEDEDEEEES